MPATKTGYVNGSDLLLYLGSTSSGAKAIGHCTSHTVTFNTETKERAVKPLASAALSSGLWKQKSITGLSISINAQGLVFYTETENGFKESFGEWKTGSPVYAKCMERGATDPYLAGAFIITSLEKSTPAGDDSTYTVTLENSGEPTVLDDTKLT